MLTLLVFVAELSVVTLSTMRIIFIARGQRLLAPMLGFFEIVIWLFAISQVMQNLTDVGCYLGFAAGFTMGNFAGLWLERKLAIGTLIVRAITVRRADDLVRLLNQAGFGVTSMDAEGATGPVTVVITVIKRRDVERVIELIKSFDSQTFYWVDEIQSAESGIFPVGKGRGLGIIPFVRRRPSRPAA